MRPRVRKRRHAHDLRDLGTAERQPHRIRAQIGISGYPDGQTDDRSLCANHLTHQDRKAQPHGNIGMLRDKFSRLVFTQAPEHRVADQVKAEILAIVDHVGEMHMLEKMRYFPGGARMTRHGVIAALTLPIGQQ